MPDQYVDVFGDTTQDTTEDVFASTVDTTEDAPSVSQQIQAVVDDYMAVLEQHSSEDLAKVPDFQATLQDPVKVIAMLTGDVPAELQGSLTTVGRRLLGEAAATATEQLKQIYQDNNIQIFKVEADGVRKVFNPVTQDYQVIYDPNPSAFETNLDLVMNVYTGGQWGVAKAAANVLAGNLSITDLAVSIGKAYIGGELADMAGVTGVLEDVGFSADFAKELNTAIGGTVANGGNLEDVVTSLAVVTGKAALEGIEFFNPDTVVDAEALQNQVIADLEAQTGATIGEDTGLVVTDTTTDTAATDTTTTTAPTTTTDSTGNVLTADSPAGGLETVNVTQKAGEYIPSAFDANGNPVYVAEQTPSSLTKAVYIYDNATGNRTGWLLKEDGTVVPDPTTALKLDVDPETGLAINNARNELILEKAALIEKAMAGQEVDPSLWRSLFGDAYGIEYYGGDFFQWPTTDVQIDTATTTATTTLPEQPTPVEQPPQTTSTTEGGGGGGSSSTSENPVDTQTQEQTPADTQEQTDTGSSSGGGTTGSSTTPVIVGSTTTDTTTQTPADEYVDVFGDSSLGDTTDSGATDTSTENTTTTGTDVGTGNTDTTGTSGTGGTSETPTGSGGTTETPSTGQSDSTTGTDTGTVTDSTTTGTGTGTGTGSGSGGGTGGGLGSGTGLGSGDGNKDTNGFMSSLNPNLTVIQQKPMLAIDYVDQLLARLRNI